MRVSEILGKTNPGVVSNTLPVSGAVGQDSAPEIIFGFIFQGLFKGNTKNAGLRLLIYEDLKIAQTIVDCLLETYACNQAENGSIFRNISRMEETEDSLKIDHSIIEGSNLGEYFSK